VKAGGGPSVRNLPAAENPLSENLRHDSRQPKCLLTVLYN
jgi:hypothetical protein